ncbi:phospholipase A2-like [Bombyx mandarina]|uniref:Phospholipase A2 n=1 Tax=Bombyx mandarina TaxID=7092 RepID=A0A6J2KEL4_BOMMA|nr:phospholipase A2-like [Bombyx mandarina]
MFRHLFCLIVLIAVQTNKAAEIRIDPDIFGFQSAIYETNFVFPGTMWCGAGHVAESYEDLGSEWETDMCCREHDHCTDLIPAGETKHGLTNDCFYARLSCECDEKFRLCLKNANTDISHTVGMTYFDTIGTKCYRKDYPVVGCQMYGGMFMPICLEYEFDKKSKQIYQWFDVKGYSE